MTARDEVLRAAVWMAFDAKGTAAFAGLCQSVIDVWVAWPLVEVNRELERARDQLVELRQRRDEALKALQDSFPSSHERSVA